MPIAQTIEPIRLEVGERLREFVDRHFRSQSEFARASEIRPQALSDYLTGKYMPGGDLLRRWASLGMNINWLLTGQGIDFIDLGTDASVRAAELEQALLKIRDGIEDTLKVGDRYEYRAGLSLGDVTHLVVREVKEPPNAELLPHRVRKRGQGKIKTITEEQAKKLKK